MCSRFHPGTRKHGNVVQHTQPVIGWQFVTQHNMNTLENLRIIWWSTWRIYTSTSYFEVALPGHTIANKNTDNF